MRIPKKLDNESIAKFINKCINRGYMVIPSLLVRLDERPAAAPLSEINYDANEYNFFHDLRSVITFLENKDIVILFDTHGTKAISIAELNINKSNTELEIFQQITQATIFENQYIILLTKKDPWPVKKVDTRDLLELSIRVDGSIVSKKHMLTQRYSASNLIPLSLTLFRKAEQQWHSQTH